METLLEDYKRKLKTVNDLLLNNKNNGSIMDEKRTERLNTKASEYRSFIVDIERAIERSKSNPSVKIEVNSENELTIYSQVENKIIEWSENGTKTAGELTRNIFKIIQK
jgi:hypothetical protein